MLRLRDEYRFAMLIPPLSMTTEGEEWAARRAWRWWREKSPSGGSGQALATLVKARGFGDDLG